MFAGYVSMEEVWALASPFFAFSHDKICAVAILRPYLVGVSIHSVDLVAFAKYLQAPQL